ncbi:MAG: hypothetical protein HY287_08975 [Planctomycetes bacterium]|nr:hypothetical protein [Planctomycetota bacterium]
MLRRVPPSLTALGRKPIPNDLWIGGRSFILRRVFKNDFFAATAMYECNGDRVLVKIQREAPFLGLPLAWVGRILANREWAALMRLQELEAVPNAVARLSPSRFARQFIEGHAMQSGERVADDFHTHLRNAVAEMHRRGMAYVDLEKCENVLVGDDGRPYLMDFQIAWYWPARRGGELWLMRAVRSWLQRGDLYHLRKLQRRTRPDQLTADELAASYRKPWFVRWHRTLTYPFTYVRRAILDRIDPRRGRSERGRVHDESAVAGAK